MKFFLDFEAEIAELEARINELRHVSNVKGTKILDEISNLEFKTKKLLKAKYLHYLLGRGCRLQDTLKDHIL